VNEQLAEARNRVRALERAQERLTQLRTESARLRERVDVLAERLAREQKDVDRLEEFSVQAVWHSLRGDKPEVLAEEKRELLYFKLKHDEAVARLAETENHRQAKSEEVDLLKDARAEYARLVAEEEHTLLNSTSPVGERMRAIGGEMAELQDALRQLKEAELAALDASTALSRVDEHLASARTWGGIDMFAGGLVATGIKHAHINQARSSLARVQVKLRAFERELGDVGRNERFSIDIGRFATFADYFLDGLMIDWFIQSRIHEARERVFSTMADVRRITSDLRAQERRARAELSVLEEERRRIVESDDDANSVETRDLS
jgi:multidrug efflux pump subunit AcrA (membrane-fusion protein)